MKKKIYTLSGRERLKSSLKIGLLTNYNQFYHYPVKAYFNIPEMGHRSIKTAFTVPKKYFKKAVHRNLLRRRMKESFRLNQFTISFSGSVEILLVYISKKEESFQVIDAAVRKILNDINKKAVSESGMVQEL